MIPVLDISEQWSWSSKSITVWQPMDAHISHTANNEFVGVDNPQTTYSVPKNTYKCIHTSEKQIKTMGV